MSKPKLDKILTDKVTLLTEKYIREFSFEFQQYKKQMSAYRSNLKTPYAEISGYQGVVIRELIKYPETLYMIFKAFLSDLEQIEFAQDKYQIWFGNKFADFRVTEGKL